MVRNRWDPRKLKQRDMDPIKERYRKEGDPTIGGRPDLSLRDYLNRAIISQKYLEITGIRSTQKKRELP